MKKLFIAIILFGCSKAPSPSRVESNTVTIGSQTFMSADLNVDTYQNGDPITTITSTGMWNNSVVFKSNPEASCYYNFQKSNVRLYNWSAVSDPRGLCPKGFHVPSKSEWQTLFNTLQNGIVPVNNVYSGIGGKLKSTDIWNSPNVLADNKSGFSAYPNGFLIGFSGGAGFQGIGVANYYWSSTGSNNTAYAWYLESFSGDVKTTNQSINSQYCVRCIQD